VNRKLRIVGLVALATIVLFGLTIIVSVPWLPSGGQSVSAAVKNWFARAPRATLLVTTDLDCDWKFDGKPRGRLRANESSTLVTGFGQHLLEATTTDGKDELRVVVELHKTEQQVAAIVLQPVQQVRVEREEAQRRAEQRRAEDLRKAEAALRQKREWELHPWLDSTSRLTFAYIGHDLDFTQAEKYCADLRLGGNTNWRLPAYNELRHLFGSVTSDLSLHPRSPFPVGGSLWTLAGDSMSGAAYDTPQKVSSENGVSIHDGMRRVAARTKLQALCVREANPR
jgi:hypothetical protein